MNFISKIIYISLFALNFGAFTLPAFQCFGADDISQRVQQSSSLFAISKTLKELNAVTYSAVHGMVETYSSRIEHYYEKSGGKAPLDWPFKSGIKYPGLWTAYKYQSTNLNHIDGQLVNVRMTDGTKIDMFKFDLNPSKKILLVDNYDLNEQQKTDLAKLKIKDVGTTEDWNRWEHGRKNTIKLAAESGYYGLYLVATNELVILDTSIIESISKFDDNSKDWVPLKK